MSLISNLDSRLVRHPKRIVFPEGADPRILQAARKFSTRKLGIPILIGKRSVIKDTALKLDINLENIKIIDPKRFDEKELFYELLRSNNKFSEEKESSLNEIIENSSYFAALMLASSQADAVVSGGTNQSSSSLRPLIQLIPPNNKNFLVSSLNIFDLIEETTGKDKELFLADCAVIPNPDIRQLANIAINTASLAYHLTNKKPRVAFLSYTSHSNSQNFNSINERIIKAKDLAIEMSHSTNIPMDIDGELQLDAALDIRVAKNKSIKGQVAGNANVLIFPDLNSANITSKAINHFTRSRQYGPILTGLSKPAAEISRGTSAGDVFGTAIMVASQAINHDLLYPYKNNKLNDDVTKLN